MKNDRNFATTVVLDRKDVMNEKRTDHLLEQVRRGRLTAAEQAELRALLGAQPTARNLFSAEAALTAALAKLPDKPVASNFTSCVLQEIEREEAKPARGIFPLRFNWLPRVAAASLAVTFAVLTYQVRTQARSTELAHSLAAVSQVAALPSAEVLKDFETVRLINAKPGADRELLALLQ